MDVYHIPFNYHSTNLFSRFPFLYFHKSSWSDRDTLVRCNFLCHSYIAIVQIIHRSTDKVWATNPYSPMKTRMPVIPALD